MLKTMRMIGTVSFVFALLIPSFGQSWSRSDYFMASGVSCGAGATLVNQTGFASLIIRASYPGMPSTGALTITFTRTTGTSATVDFEFQASYDNGVTWTTSAYVTVSIPTNSLAASDVVRYTAPINVYGVSHLRLSRIVNNDGATALTACNATFSL